MALPPNARAKRGNASRYCCGSGHAHRQGGSPRKAKVNAARHRSASAAIAVRMNGSGMIFFVSFVVFPHVSENSPRANDKWQEPAATRKSKAARKSKASANSARQRIFCLLERSRFPDPDDDPDGSCSPGTTHWH